MGYFIFFIGLGIMLFGMISMIKKNSSIHTEQVALDKSNDMANQSNEYLALLSKVSLENTSNFDNIKRLILELGTKLEEIELSNVTNNNKLDRLVEQHKDITNESNISLVEMIERLIKQSQLTYDKTVFSSITTADEICNKLLLLIEQNDLKINYYEATNKIEYVNLESYFDSLSKSIS
ncbi:hypothetical protein [Fusibacter bizertensis]